MASRRNSWRLLVLSLVAGALLLACQSGDSDSSDATPSPAAPGDVAGSKDFPAIPRYPGSRIVQYNQPGATSFRCAGLKNAFTAALTTQRYALSKDEAPAGIIQFFKDELTQRGWTAKSVSTDQILLTREPVDCGDGSQQAHYTVSIEVSAGEYEVAYAYPADHEPYD